MNVLFFAITLFTFQGVLCLKNSHYTYDDDFSFGVATSAYQIEGGWNASGKGISFWDYVTHNTDLIEDGSNGDIACDSYSNINNDIEMLKYLGVRHYRFSIEWSRILPTGMTNEVNWAGVAYYDELISKLLENEIEPWVTIYHFNHPYNIEILGGWFQPQIAEYLAEYADLLFKLFGDRVKTWITINEPYSICVGGMGLLQTGNGEYICGQNILKAHAAIWKIYQERYRSIQNGKLSMAFNLQAYLPATDDIKDIEAAERVKQFAFGWFVHPLVYGNYPQNMIETVEYYSKNQGLPESRLPQLSLEDLLMLKGAYDFIGLNNYDTFLVHGNNSTIDKIPSYANDIGAKIITDPGWNSSYSIQMKSKGLGVILNWIKNTYKDPEIRITEQGIPDKTGDLLDTDRHSYLLANMAQLLQSIINDKVRVTAYTFWSLMDNFEWTKGYSVKYGLHHVDFNNINRTRTPKLSSLTFSMIARTKSLKAFNGTI